VRLVRALDRNHRVTMVPFQQPGAPEAHGLTVAECERAAWSIAPDGTKYRGAGAVDMAVAVAVGSSLPYRLYTLPGMRQVQDRVYAWIATHRGRLPGDTPYCEQHPEECGDMT
jgi:predicted DCC family thiol-disulfide oxidoreductase YuxK